ncbi:MAG: hypothetical protein KAV87_63385 [Desulfobacteraceae bacterium]|nr:hypothetical protein [Desulfobacteraceae bacterium]
MNYTPAEEELLYDGEFAYGPQDVEVYEAQVPSSRPVNWMWPAAALLLGTALQMIVQKAIGPVFQRSAP